MKKIIFICLLLVGCASNPAIQPPKVVKESVWTPPKVVIPQRPVLKSDGKGTDAEVAKKAMIDETLLEEYSLKLENIIKSFQNTSNNK